MGERATGGAWGARDEASWWPANTGDIQQQEQISEDVARSTAASTHQLYSYKVAGGFSNNGVDTTTNYNYRIMSSAESRSDSPQQQQQQQQQWWYGGASVDSHQQNSSPTHNQSSPGPDQGNQQQSNGIQHNQQSIQQSQQEQQSQSQQIQQNLQQQQNQQQQSLQQMLQQQSQQQQALQQTLQQTLSQVQAQAIVQQAQQAIQQQVAQSLQQQTIQEHIQAVQQQQIQAALQRQTVTLHELQQQAHQQALIAQAAAKSRMPRARADNKPRGRMTAYAFFVQTCREEHKKKHPDENVVFAAFSKKCAERWNTMVEKDKQRFHAMAEQDKRRYDIEMQSYVPPKGAKIGRGKKRKQPKDPNAPKRSLSAFFWFCNDERSKVKAANPEYTMGDIAKELGRRWASATPETKTKYEALSEQDKARYDREMMVYKNTPMQPHEYEESMLCKNHAHSSSIEMDDADFEVDEF